MNIKTDDVVSPIQKKVEGEHLNIARLLADQTKELTELKEEIILLKKKVFWMAIGGYIKILIIIVPLIIAGLILFPYLRQVIDFFSFGQGSELIKSVQNINKFLNQ